jgi:hypothetical protein
MSRKVLYIAVAISLIALILIAAKKHGTIGYYASPTGNWGTVKITEEFTPVQNLSLPPGSYIANASAVVSSEDLSSGYVHVDCIFMLHGFIRGEASRATVGGTVTTFITLPLTIGFTIEEPTDLVVACRSTGTQVWSQPTSITAIRVENLVIQEGFQP